MKTKPKYNHKIYDEIYGEYEDIFGKEENENGINAESHIKAQFRVCRSR